MSNRAAPVLFDLDQTIIPWDTQLVFRSFVLRREPARRLLTLVFIVFLPLTKLLGTGGMKRVFHSYLWGMSRRTLEGHVEAFLQEWLPKITYPEIVAIINDYREKGHHLILSSASPEIWVKGIGKELGFDTSFGTRFEWPDRLPLFPDLIGENHKGSEKVRRLASINLTSAEAGYTDSKADLPLLALCREKYLVNPLPGIRKTGEENNWPILTPPRPWKNRLSFGIGCARQLFGFWKP